MKREIKFRAWAISEKKMCNVTTLTDRGAFLVGIEPMGDQYFDSGKFVIESCKDGRCLNNGEFELMQFTGLLDKNGKEIYGGDIVFYEDRKWNVVFEYDRWDMKNGDMYVRYDDLQDDPGFTDWEKSVVIGNIYENPKLL